MHDPGNRFKVGEKVVSNPMNERLGGPGPASIAFAFTPAR
jgi:hypothetical protein